MIVRQLLEEKGLKQAEVARRMGMKPQAFASILKKNNPTRATYEKLANAIGVDVTALYPSSGITKIEEREARHHVQQFGTPASDIEYVELPYVSVAARAHFVEMGGLEENTYRSGETYRVPHLPGQSIKDQFVFEVNGDSMEPYYWAGMKVQATYMKSERWPFLSSGPYVVVYADFFVIKRLKSNNYQEGYFMLHSDNTTTGGSMQVPIEQIRSIWRVESVVYAPAR